MIVAFETVHLSARPPELEDAPRITEFFQEESLVKMLGRAPWPYTLKDAKQWIKLVTKTRAKGTEYAFALHHPDHGLVGSVGMFRVQDDIWEIGYWIGKPYWGKGYVTEAAKGLLDWAEHEMGITRYVSGHIFDNPASGHVLEKLGFERVGEIDMYVKGRDCKVASPRYIRNAPVEVALKQPFAAPKP